MDHAPRSSPLLIAAFAKATGLPRETIRFYVRKGLLVPTVHAGSGNRYQHFDDSHVERALLIRLGRSLGFTLREILAYEAEYSERGMPLERQAAIAQRRIDEIDAHADRMREVRTFLERKVAWLRAGGVGDPPQFP